MLKNWIVYYLLLAASVVFALLYPGQVSSAFFYALLALPPLSFAVCLAMRAGFRFRQELKNTSAVKGDSVAYRLTVRNRTPFLLSCVEIEFHDCGPAFEQALRPRRLAAPPLSRGTLEIRLDCPLKGAYEVGLKRIRIRDYLGLFSFGQDVSPLCTLTVYPRILPVEGFPLVAGYVVESLRLAERTHDITENISDIRKYTSGDRLRAVHWKLSAKREELMVKNFEQTSGASAELVIDASGLAGGKWDAAFAEDRLAECAASLLWHFASRSVPSTVHYVAGKTERHTVNNARDFHAVYSALAETTLAADHSLPDAAALPRSEGSVRKTVAVVTSALSEALCCQALGLKAQGCPVVIVRTGPACVNASEEALEASLTQYGIAVACLAEGCDIGKALSKWAV